MPWESTVVLASPASTDLAGLGSFDQHLDQARKAADRSSEASFEPSPGQAAPGSSKTPAKECPRESPRDDSQESADKENADANPAPAPAANQSGESPSSDEQAADSADVTSGDNGREIGDDAPDSDEDPVLAFAAAAAGAAATAFHQGVENAPGLGPDAESAPPADFTADSVKAAAYPSGVGRAANRIDAATAASDAASQTLEPTAASQAALELAAGDAGGASPGENGGDATGAEVPDASGQKREPSALPAEAPVNPANVPAVSPTSALAADGATDSASSADSSAPKASAPQVQGLQGGLHRSGAYQNARTPGESQAAANATQAAANDEQVALGAAVQLAGAKPAEADRPASGGESKVAAGSTGSNPASDARAADAAAAPGAQSPVSGESAQQTAESTSGDAAERAQFVQRVVRAFESAADRAGHVRMRLYPPELGSLRLDLTIRNGQMTARMETETQSAQNTLLDNLPALKERLAEHHITVERFDVEWQGQGQGGLSQGADGQTRWQTPSAGSMSGTAGKTRGTTGTDVAAQTSRRLSPGTSFDVVI